MDEMKRLVRELLEAWDQWIDADARLDPAAHVGSGRGWHGPELDRLAEIVKLLREKFQEP